MSAWAEWWYGDATKEEYESSVRLEELKRSSLIDRILGVEVDDSDKDHNEVYAE